MVDKQKAISKRTGRWVYGTYFDGFILSGSVIDVSDDYIAVEAWEPVKPETVCNCTGLVDDDGTLIFEHDVIYNNAITIGDRQYFEIKRTSSIRGFHAYDSYRPNYARSLPALAVSCRIVGNTCTKSLHKIEAEGLA